MQIAGLATRRQPCLHGGNKPVAKMPAKMPAGRMKRRNHGVRNGCVGQQIARRRGIVTVMFCMYPKRFCAGKNFCLAGAVDRQ